MEEGEIIMGAGHPLFQLIKYYLIKGKIQYSTGYF